MISRLLGSLLGKSHRRNMSRVLHSCQFQPLEPRLLLSAVSGRVWLDANINGLQDTGESDLSGVTVVLYDQSGTEQDSQTTEADGLFDFTSVNNGTYYLQFEDSILINEVEHLLTISNAGTDPNLDSDAVVITSQTALFTVNGTDDKTDLAAGYARFSTVLGRVWLDANINGIQDPGESDLSGVTVVLNDQGDIEQASQITDTDGLFEFKRLTGGTFYIQLDQSIQIDDIAHQLTFQKSQFGGLSLPTLDSDTATNTGKTAPFTLDGTDDITELAAGYAPIFAQQSTVQVLAGQSLDFSALFAGTGYLSNYEATINWGDGQSDDMNLVTDPTVNGQLGNLNLNFDFETYDSNGFFALNQSDGQLRRDLLQYAAVTLVNRFDDTLTDITPNDNNTWWQRFYEPNTGTYAEIDGINIATNELLFYAGGRNLGSSTLGVGGPGAYRISYSSDYFHNAVIGRGQESTVTDFARWGGSISFDTDSSWYFGIDNDQQGFSDSDFLSVALHEMAHALGFGTADSWDNLLSNDTFTGAAATAYYMSAPPVDPLSDAHFAKNTIDLASGQEAAMDPNITTGTRKYFTKLDFAVMDDIGWDLLDTFDIASDGEVAGSHSYSTPGTKTVTLYLLNAEGGLATYTVDIEVIDAFQIVNVDVNTANFDIDDAGLTSPNFSQSIQRSVLQSVVVEFSRAVNELSTDDIQLKLIYQDGTTFEPDMSSATFASDDGNVTVKIDLRGVTLEDGVYELFVFDTVTDVSTGGSLDGDANTLAGGTYQTSQSNRFHQFGGDFNGDAKFNISDLGALQHYWNKNDPDTPSYIDINNDDNVDGDDMANFASWMARLNTEVVEQDAALLTLAVDPPTPSANMAMALASYQNNQASLTLVESDDNAGAVIEYEDLIGQWLSA